VLGFVAGRLGKSFSRLVYGLTREKAWKVATAPLPEPVSLESLRAALSNQSGWTPIARPADAQFLADPFFHPEGGLLVEAMASTGRGQILHITANGVRRLSRRGGHFSYPSVVHERGRDFVVPEVSDWSAALAYPLEAGQFGESFQLRVPGRPRLLDPTAFHDGKTLYLFGNIAGEGSSVLRLWTAASLDGEFAEHPSSPIRISPNGARMAGGLARIDGQLIRVGQDLRGPYGNGISFFRVTSLDRQTYAEVPAGGLQFTASRGPHTLNLGRGRMAFDYYSDDWSLLAGLRRLRRSRAASRITS
jgi:hypothetical protein